MDAGVDGSFGLAALQVGRHGLFTHAHGGKHLSNALKHGDEENGVFGYRGFRTAAV